MQVYDEMNDGILNDLAQLKRQFDQVVPAALKKAAESPELKTIIEISRKAQETIPIALTAFTEAIAPYAEIGKQVTVQLTPYLLAFASLSSRFAVIDRLGRIQYVAWVSFPESFYEQAARTKDDHALLECVYEWHKENRFIDIEETLNKLSENEHLKDNPVFQQSISAYEDGNYDIAALGFTAMIDRMLSEYSGMITSTKISKRIAVIKEKVENDGEASLENNEVNDYILISTYFTAIDAFGKDSRFLEPEPELNRHWIAHGRMNRRMVQIDCIRIINFLYGTILVGEIGKKSEGLPEDTGPADL